MRIFGSGDEKAGFPTLRPTADWNVTGALMRRRWGFLKCEFPALCHSDVPIRPSYADTKCPSRAVREVLKLGH